MKKLLMLFPLAIMALSGCGGSSYNSETERENWGANFELICEHRTNSLRYVYFVRDCDTDIIYFTSSLSNSLNGLSVYYNEEGQPMNYEQFKIAHVAKYHQ